MPERQLTEKERRRLERFERSRQNKRGRKKPSALPAKLTRTSAFAPRSKDLITDSNFRRLYIVPGHSVIMVAGRELGTAHRDAIYAAFREKTQTYYLPSSTGTPGKRVGICETRTTWRTLILNMGLTEHTNNIMTLSRLYEEINKVVMTVQEGNVDLIVENYAKGKLTGAGEMKNIFRNIKWDGIELDSEVTFEYGEWTREMFQRVNLVSLNAEVQFSLKSDYAKTFWPYIDGQPNNTFVTEDLLASLCGRDLWDEGETSQTRAKFRKTCRRAFDDMVNAKGLKSWEEQEYREGRHKKRRYHYIHFLPRQMELGID